MADYDDGSSTESETYEELDVIDEVAPLAPTATSASSAALKTEDSGGDEGAQPTTRSPSGTNDDNSAAAVAPRFHARVVCPRCLQALSDNSSPQELPGLVQCHCCWRFSPAEEMADPETMVAHKTEDLAGPTVASEPSCMSCAGVSPSSSAPRQKKPRGDRCPICQARLLTEEELVNRLRNRKKKPKKKGDADANADTDEKKTVESEEVERVTCACCQQSLLRVGFSSSQLTYKGLLARCTTCCKAHGNPGFRSVIPEILRAAGLTERPPEPPRPPPKPLDPRKTRITRGMTSNGAGDDAPLAVSALRDAIKKLKMARRAIQRRREGVDLRGSTRAEYLNGLQVEESKLDEQAAGLRRRNPAQYDKIYAETKVRSAVVPLEERDSQFGKKRKMPKSTDKAAKSTKKPKTQAKGKAKGKNKATTAGPVVIDAVPDTAA